MTFAIVSSSWKRLNILLKKHNDEIEGNEAQFWLNIYVGVTIDNSHQCWKIYSTKSLQFVTIILNLWDLISVKQNG